MPPPFLVDIDGNPYPPALQRLVPGRETSTDQQLIPYVAAGAGAAPPIDVVNDPDIDQEPRNNRLGAILFNNNMQQPQGEDHHLIDERIQQMQREIQRGHADNVEPLEPYDRARENQRNGANLRNGDVQGVRQSANFLSLGGANLRPIWCNKPIVPSLSEYQIAEITKRQLSIAAFEEEYYAQERKKRAEITEIAAIKLATQQSKFTRSKRRIITQRRGVRITPRRAEVENIDEVIVEESDDEADRDFSAEEFSSSSPSEDESSDSDWIAKPSGSVGPSISRSTVAATSKDPIESSRSERRRRRRPVQSSEDDCRNDNTNEEDATERNHSGPSVLTLADRRKKAENRRNKRNRNGPVPSSPPDNETRRRDQLNQLRTIQQRRHAQQFQSFTELPESFRPPEWLTETKPKKTPYFPQIGDEVVYFRSGHQDYLNKVREKKIYSIKPTTKPYKLKG